MNLYEKISNNVDLSKVERDVHNLADNMLKVAEELLPVEYYPTIYINIPGEGRFALNNYHLIPVLNQLAASLKRVKFEEMDFSDRLLDDIKRYSQIDEDNF